MEYARLSQVIADSGRKLAGSSSRSIPSARYPAQRSLCSQTVHPFDLTSCRMKSPGGRQRRRASTRSPGSSAARTRRDRSRLRPRQRRDCQRRAASSRSTPRDPAALVGTSPRASASISPSSARSCRSIAASPISSRRADSASSVRRAPRRSSSAARCSRKRSWRATAFRRRATGPATMPATRARGRGLGRARLSARRQGRRPRRRQGRRRRARSRDGRSRRCARRWRSGSSATPARGSSSRSASTGPEVSFFAICDGTPRRGADVGAGSQARLRRRRGAEHRRDGRVRAEPARRRGDAGADHARDRRSRGRAGSRAEGIEYRGFLYAGLMLTCDGPKVIEFNVRFGDPEAQVVIPMIADDLAPRLAAAADGALDAAPIAFRTRCRTSASCSRARGYPGPVTGGVPISGLDAAARLDDVLVFHAGHRAARRRRRHGRRARADGGRPRADLRRRHRARLCRRVGRSRSTACSTAATSDARR